MNPGLGAHSEPAVPVQNQAHLYDHPASHSEVPVKPRVPDAPSVGFHTNLHHAHLPPLRAALHLGKRRAVTASLALPPGLVNWQGLGRAC